MITREKAWELLNSHMKNQNLIRHCLSVEAVMRALAKHFIQNGTNSARAENDPESTIEMWGIVGLLHDGDYEETKETPTQHTLKMAQWLKDAGETDQEILEAILSHNFAHTGQNPPKNTLEWSLYCCDELTGLIVAVALVKGKSLANVNVESIFKKFPEKNFAAGVHREQISACEEKLNIPLAEFVQIALVAMQGIYEELGL